LSFECPSALIRQAASLNWQAAHLDFKTSRRELRRIEVHPDRPVCGVEVELQLIADSKIIAPEVLFGSPDAFIPPGPVRWYGKPVPLPHGGIVYFDRGVIEVVTPPIELTKTAAPSAVDCIWDEIKFVRNHLDAWETRNRRKIRLRGYSAHYNISFNTARRSKLRTLDQLSYLLCHILPFPLILLATNNSSSGVGVRPRRNRIEVTIDFTPEPALMLAAAALIIGITNSVIQWDEYTVSELRRRNLPTLKSFTPKPHTSRNGWLAHATSFSSNPFHIANSNVLWETERHGRLNIRQFAHSIIASFLNSIKAFADTRTLELILAGVQGRRKCLRESESLPASYQNVQGASKCRLKQWSANHYAGILARCHAGTPLVLDGRILAPKRMLGWFLAEFQDARMKKYRVTFDAILESGGQWLSSAP
jgi:hypothetical protein